MTNPTSSLPKSAYSGGLRVAADATITLDAEDKVALAANPNAVERWIVAASAGLFFVRLGAVASTGVGIPLEGPLSDGTAGGVLNLSEYNGAVHVYGTGDVYVTEVS